MVQVANVNFYLDEDVKQSMEQACLDLGLSMTEAFTIFAKKVGSEKCIPFDVAVDPFYSERNIEHLQRGIMALNAGKGVAHELIEVEDK